MIAYFDTSALVALLIEEPGSDQAAALWDRAGRVVSARVAYPEARAALAKANRERRITDLRQRQAVRDLDRLVERLDIVEITEELAHRAGELAEHLALRGYDAVHMAAAEALHDGELVLVAGDAAVLRAGNSLGLTTAATS